jgi:CHAD domain-containing protein
MKLDRAMLRRPAAEGIRLVALELLTDAEKAADHLANAPNAKSLHAFRVALRRLRSWLRAFKRELKTSVRVKDRRALRDIARSTNLGRDLDMQLELLRLASKRLGRKRRKGVDWLVHYVRTRQRKTGDRLDALLVKEFEKIASELTDRLSKGNRSVSRATPRATQTLAAAIAAHLPAHGDDLRSTLDKIRSAQDENHAHEARIAAKRLRYLAEPVAPFVKKGAPMLKTLKAMQDELGALHNSHVLIREIGAAIENAETAEASKLLAQPRGARARRRRTDALIVSVPRDELLAVAEDVRDEARDQFRLVRKHWIRGRRSRLNHQISTFSKRLTHAGRPK